MYLYTRSVHKYIDNVEKIEAAFQTVLQNKFMAFDSLAMEEKLYLLNIYEEGYSMIKVDPYDIRLSKGEQIDALRDYSKRQINPQKYNTALAVAGVIGFGVSFVIKD